MHADPATGRVPAKLKVALVDPDTDEPFVRPLFEAMRAQSNGPLNIHRVIANAPAVYEGFAAFASALRAPGATSRAERELAILRTNQLQQSEYEFIQHRRIGLSVGLTAQEVDDLADWRTSESYDPRQRQILALTDRVVAGTELGSASETPPGQPLSAQELVEITMVAAFYVAVARFTHTIDIEPEACSTTYGEG